MVKAQSRLTPGLIVTRTPLRVSFAGGGTDLAAFSRHEYGAVLSTAIDKYVYVTLMRHNELFSESIRLNYSETETVETVDDLKNDIARECLRFLDIEPPIYISTIASLPAATGLGSSSSFAVGLLNALHIYRGENASAGQLAEEAAHIEIDVLKRPIGKQDHYATSYGGFNLFRFLLDGEVSIEPQRFQEDSLSSLFSHILMFWTGISRDSQAVLAEQQRNTKDKMAELLMMRDHAHQLQEMLRNGFDAVRFGHLLDSSWQLKRGLASTITTDQIDRWYRLAVEAGALGGKLCGAGGGGFLLFIVPTNRHASVRQALGDMLEITVRPEPRGSRVLMPNAE